MSKRVASSVPGGRTTRAGRAYAGLSHEERVAQRRARFVLAGIACFGRLGYHASTVRAICAEAGLTDRYFYESFRGTEDLLCAAFGELAQALLHDLLQAIAQAPAAQDAQIEACLQRYFAFMRDAQAARVLLMEVLGVSPTVDALYQRTNGEFAKRILVPWIEAAAEGGPPRARGDDRVLSIALAGAVTSAATLWVLSSYRQPAAQMVANCRRVIEGALALRRAPA